VVKAIKQKTDISGIVINNEYGFHIILLFNQG